jgi:hypothetical protein
MTDIGVQPTATSVKVTSSNGSPGVVSAATNKSAGIMTADHVKILQKLVTDVALVDRPEQDTGEAMDREIVAALLERVSNLEKGVAALVDIPPVRCETSNIAGERPYYPVDEQLDDLHKLVTSQGDGLPSLLNMVENDTATDEQLEEFNEIQERIASFKALRQILSQGNSIEDETQSV